MIHESIQKWGKKLQKLLESGEDIMWIIKMVQLQLPFIYVSYTFGVWTHADVCLQIGRASAKVLCPDLFVFSTWILQIYSSSSISI